LTTAPWINSLLILVVPRHGQDPFDEGGWLRLLGLAANRRQHDIGIPLDRKAEGRDEPPGLEVLLHEGMGADGHSWPPSA
jgi:hypothetical protein